MKSLKILTINILALTIPTFGQEEHQIDQDLKTCLSIDSNQTTQGMNRCTYRGEDSWDKELNKYYTSLINKLDSTGQKQLLEAQRQWINYRDKEFEFMKNYYYEKKQGTMWSNVAAGSRYDLVKARALELKNYYEMLDY
jgi:uncharacterized protein YecT (DUF1311 family)